ncbi:HAD family hydrolase [Neptunomonas antarctica]|uniref:Sugar-phosphatase n=1 Tax=Neptunomonas antarctica TaxID=619304 RepID=A0A1N7L2A8_9GAMM|nr:HAD family phosphatase [Neptunomonas antarctica]SIS67921.1 sugar-phosphatase [Neptunomonas antarctica]
MQFAIFDMDGLLVDSEPVWQRVERRVLQQLYGLDLSLNEVAAYSGMSTRELSIAIARAYPDADINAVHLCAAILEEMSAAIGTAPVMPGAVELLERIAELDLPLAIASSSPLSFIESVVRKHALPVRLFTSGTEVEFSKPHPAVFQLAAQRIGAQPWQCRVWEDSLNGVIAAKAACMNVVAVPDPEHPTPEKFAIADMLHMSLWESLNIFYK